MACDHDYFVITLWLHFETDSEISYIVFCEKQNKTYVS